MGKRPSGRKGMPTLKAFFLWTSTRGEWGGGGCCGSFARQRCVGV
jgi:hypothetical protein